MLETFLYLILLQFFLYRDFLCSQDEKRRLQEKDARELQEVQKAIEDEIRQKYNPDDLFKKKNGNNNEHQNFEETAIAVAQKEKWYKKIFNIIKGLFNKK